MDVEQVYREAVARVQARRQPAEYEPARTGWGETRIQKKLPEFKAPGTAAEFFDDQIGRTKPSLGPWIPVLYEIARADGAPAAVAAVGTARRLSPWHQWNMYCAFKRWRDAETTATPLTASAILRAAWGEWERLGLASCEPTDEPLPVAPERPEPKRAKVTYRSRYGHPAGLAY